MLTDTSLQSFSSFQFNQLIQSLLSLNQKCLTRAREFSELIGPHKAHQSAYYGRPQELEILNVKRLSFGPVSTVLPEKLFVMRIEGEKKKQTFQSMARCFRSSGSSSTSPEKSEWKNKLRTPLPRFEFFDMTEEIKVYQMLDPQNENCLEEIKGFVQGLQNVEQELEQRVKKVKETIGLGERVMRLFNQKLEELSSSSEGSPSIPTQPIVQSKHPRSRALTEGTQELFFVLKDKDPFVKRFRLDFEIELTHERAVANFETFEALIEQYFEVVGDQKDFKEREKEQRAKKEKEQTGKRLREEKEYFMGSEIADTEDQDIIFRWLEESRGGVGSVTKVSLLYRGSKDGFRGQDFHSRCDSQGPTVVLFRTTGGRKGGGYAHISWHSRGQWSEDTKGKSFLFSLDHLTKHNYRPNTGFAIYGSSKCGPVFGPGNDLRLSHNCHLDESSSSSPSSYLIPDETHLAGSKNFQVEDYEVWRVE